MSNSDHPSFEIGPGGRKSDPKKKQANKNDFTL